jgi:hypothetical protein
MLQKNMMEHLGQIANNMNTARNSLAGAGTQTAAVAFGGGPPVAGATEEYNGTSWTNSNQFKYSKKLFSRCWNSNMKL